MAKFTIMKRVDGDMEHLPELLESVASIIGDEDLSQDEREAMLAQTFELYAEFTGRSGLDDIAATTKSERQKEMDNDNVDLGAGAMFGLECLASAIRKREPELTEAQSFLRACNERPDILKIEREASRRRIAGVGLAQTEPEILQTLSDADIKRLIARERARFPFVDGKELLAIVENSPEMREHRAAVRQAQAAGRRAGSSLEVAKRAQNDAMSDLRGKADELLKADPRLTPEGAFTKAYRLYPDIARRERNASRAAIFAG